MADWPTVSLTAALVLITGYYAWQNKRMVEEMRRQNGPYLYVFHDGDWLVIKNGGVRSAHHIKITLLKDADVPKQYRTFAIWWSVGIASILLRRSASRVTRASTSPTRTTTT